MPKAENTNSLREHELGKSPLQDSRIGESTIEKKKIWLESFQRGEVCDYTYY